MDELDVIESLPLDEFDPGARIDRMSDGSLQLRFDAMPPSWATRATPFDTFQTDLSRAIERSVEGLDRELFAVRDPGADTVERIRAFLVSLRPSG